MADVDVLKRYLGEFYHLTDRGNSAILLAFMAAKKHSGGKYVIIPDQGGWMAYEKLAKKAGLDVVRVKTKDGVIDTDFVELDSVFKKVGFENVACIILTEPAGYCLKQNIEEVALRIGDYYDLEESKAILIVDCSGSIGWVAKGHNIYVGSFGEWKPVELGYGGFIATPDKEFDDFIKEARQEISTDIDFDEKRLPELVQKLERVKDRYEFLWKHCKKIVKDLRQFDVLWDKGIVVIVKYKNPEEKNQIIKYCRDNGYEYTECPRDIRINDKAISIEVKRLKASI